MAKKIVFMLQENLRTSRATGVIGYQSPIKDDPLTISDNRNRGEFLIGESGTGMVYGPFMQISSVYQAINPLGFVRRVEGSQVELNLCPFRFNFAETGSLTEKGILWKTIAEKLNYDPQRWRAITDFKISETAYQVIREALRRANAVEYVNSDSEEIIDNVVFDQYDIEGYHGFFEAENCELNYDTDELNDPENILEDIFNGNRAMMESNWPDTD